MLVYYNLDPIFVVLAIISISYDNVRIKVVAEMWERGNGTAKCDGARNTMMGKTCKQLNQIT